MLFTLSGVCIHARVPGAPLSSSQETHSRTPNDWSQPRTSVIHYKGTVAAGRVSSHCSFALRTTARGNMQLFFVSSALVDIICHRSQLPVRKTKAKSDREELCRGGETAHSGHPRGERKALWDSGSSQEGQAAAFVNRPLEA